jgi:hypothetical protein
VVNFETIFGVPSQAFTRLIDKTFVAPGSTLEDIHWPTDDEFHEIPLTISKFRQIAVIDEGRVIRIPRQKNLLLRNSPIRSKRKQESFVTLNMYI